MRPYHRHVGKNAGLNPVAQAVARRLLEKSILDQRIMLFMLKDGEACADSLAGLCGLMQIVLRACHIEEIATPDVSMLKGGLNACIQVMMSNRYDETQTIAISAGLDKALMLARKVKPNSINKAWAGDANV